MYYDHLKSVFWALLIVMTAVCMIEELHADSELPGYVDNSLSPHFPPIRSQGNLGSCASFTSTYYTMTYMTALARNWDVTNGLDNSNKFSPKWTYNMINGGSDGGSIVTNAYNLLLLHGAATWSEVPYDNNYLEWVYNRPEVWQSAIGHRILDHDQVRGVQSAEGIRAVKALLAEGKILNVETAAYSWQFKSIGDDPSTDVDDAFVGKPAIYYVNGSSGGHAVAIVGYHDDLWIDINSNGAIDSGEKGAFRMANSWGTGWGDGGFAWMAYDSLLGTSAVTGGPTVGRQAAWGQDRALWLTARESYTPLMTAEFVLHTAKRSQFSASLGIGSAGAEAPARVWKPATGVLQQSGGGRGFDGVQYADAAAAPNGSFVFDFSDLEPAFGESRRYFLSVNDWYDDSYSTSILSFALNDGQGRPLGAAGNLPQSDSGGYYTSVYGVIDTALTKIVVRRSKLVIGEGQVVVAEVKLAEAPQGTVVLTASKISGDPDIVVIDGANLTFTSADWDTFKPLLIGAAHDADDTGGTAIIEISGESLGVHPLTVYEVDDEAIYTAMMDEDPGWSLSGEWAYGEPLGQGGAFGYPDPVSGLSGPQVIGYNLAGDYLPDLAATQWAVTPAIDCSNCRNVRLSFQRRLNLRTPIYDKAYLQASNDGTNWHSIWGASQEVSDRMWVKKSYDLSGVADGQSTVYLRWGLGPTGPGGGFSGWNIDDVVVTGDCTSSPTATATPVPSQTVTATPTRTATPTHTRTPTATRTHTATPTRTATAIWTYTVIPTKTPTRTATATITATRTPTSTATALPTATNQPTATPKLKKVTRPVPPKRLKAI